MNEISSSRFMVALRCEKRDMDWYGKPAVVVHKMDTDDMNKAMKVASDLGGIFIFSGDCLLSSVTVPEGSVINSDINALDLKAEKKK